MAGAINQVTSGTGRYDWAAAPGIREQAATIARSEDMAAARAFLAEHPGARSVLDDELLRTRQYHMIHALSARAPLLVAQAQNSGSDTPLILRMPGGRQFHASEIALIKHNAQRFADQLSASTGQRFSAAEAERVLAQAAYWRINPGAAEPEQAHLAKAAFDFLAAINPRELLPADPSVPGAQQAFYFSSTPMQRADSRIYSATLQSHAEFYRGNGLLRDPGGAAARVEEFNRRLTNAENWTFSAPAIAAGTVLVPIAPTLVANARFYVLANPMAAMEGTELVGGFILGDALPAGASLGPAAAVAIAARTEGNFMQRAGRAFSELFDTPARETVQRIQSSIVRAVAAGNRQRAEELARGVVDIIGTKGRIGEAATREFVESQGYEVIGKLVNGSDNGFDLVARAANGRIAIIEVKATSTGERTAERKLQSEAKSYFDRVFNSADQGKGRYANITPESRPVLERLREARRNGEDFDYRWAVVYMSEDHQVQGLVMDRWAQTLGR